MKRYYLILLLLIGSSWGQSAYNRLGYGDMYQAVDPLEASLGNGLVAYEDSIRIHLTNPAGLNGLKRVFFGGSLSSEYRGYDEAVVNNTRFDQVHLALPLGQNLAMSLSIRALADFEANYQSGTGVVEQSRGGIWDYQLGLGYALIPQISLGAKLHYLHGFLRREYQAETTGEAYALKGGITGKSLELGAVSHIGDQFTLGMTADLPVQQPVLTSSDSLGGTATSDESEETLSAWPLGVKVGLVYQASRRTRFVNGFAQYIFPADGFDEARIFALPAGWQTVPVASFQSTVMRSAMDRNSRDWVQRTGYSAGISIKNFYLNSEDNNLIYEYSVLTGLVHTLKNGRSLYEISGEFGQRQGTDALPDEWFARIKFGIQVNDIWFRKAKRR
jgi:hypothetical protein